MAERILAENEHIQTVNYALPNKHYIPVDMRYAGIDNLTPYVLPPSFALLFFSAYLACFFGASCLAHRHVLSAQPTASCFSCAPRAIAVTNPRSADTVTPIRRCCFGHYSPVWCATCCARALLGCRSLSRGLFADLRVRAHVCFDVRGDGGSHLLCAVAQRSSACFLLRRVTGPNWARVGKQFDRRRRVAIGSSSHRGPPRSRVSIHIASLAYGARPRCSLARACHFIYRKRGRWGALPAVGRRFAHFIGVPAFAGMQAPLGAALSPQHRVAQSRGHARLGRGRVPTGCSHAIVCGGRGGG